MYPAKARKYLIIALIAGWGLTAAYLNICHNKNTHKIKPQPKLQNQELYKDTQLMMGTFVEVISPDKKASNIAFTEIKRVENLLSKYNPDSEISKLNKSGACLVSPETYYVIKKAKEFWLASDGAFDITVGPLLDLWGFTDKNYGLPEEKSIKDTLARVGSDKIILNKENNVVEFIVPGMKIDLGAIAKGFAVDCAIDKLKKASIKNCLINAGGDIYCIGDRLGKDWKVAIQNPSGNGFTDCLLLKNQAVATSGNYEQFFLKNKKRYAHIFNPKTGEPSDLGIASVTVIAQDCLTADALATSIFVLGKAKGEVLSKKFPNVKTIVIEES